MRLCKVCGCKMVHNDIEMRWECPECSCIIEEVTAHGDRYDEWGRDLNKMREVWL